MKINLILLASGYSRRFNGNKLLTEINDKPMFMNVVDEVLKLDFNNIIIVTQYEGIKEKLKNKNINIIMNENSDLGISNSIHLGIKEDKSADAYMFMVCDQPFIKASTIKKLIDSFVESDKGLACIEFNNKLYNPTIFSKKYLNSLLDLKGDTGGKSIINKNLQDLERVEIYNSLEVTDIDTKEVFYAYTHIQ